MAIFRRIIHSRKNASIHRCIALKRFFQQGNISRRVFLPPRFYSAKKCNARLVLFPSFRIRKSFHCFPSSLEYDSAVSAEKRRIAARFFQIILLAHSLALLHQTSFLHGHRRRSFLWQTREFLSVLYLRGTTAEWFPVKDKGRFNRIYSWSALECSCLYID